MQITQPDYYDSFSCIADRCPDTCCVGWQVLLDAEHAAYYQTLPGELGEDLRKGIVTCDGEPALAMHKGRCCMLREDGLCRIHYSLGESALSSVCSFYPRFVTELGLLREQGLSISCPEVARIILTKKDPVVYPTYVTNEPLRYFHDIEPEDILAVRKGRELGIQLMQDRSQTLASRLQAILRLGATGDALPSHDSIGAAGEDEYQLFRKELYALYFSLERLRMDWTELLSQAQEKQGIGILDDQIAWEQLVCYHIFKYSLRSAMDRSFELKLRLIVVQLLLLQECYQTGVDLIYLVQLHAKETEHNEDNLVALERALSNKPCFSTDSLLHILQRF